MHVVLAVGIGYFANIQETAVREVRSAISADNKIENATVEPDTQEWSLLFKRH